MTSLPPSNKLLLTTKVSNVVLFSNQLPQPIKLDDRHIKLEIWRTENDLVSILNGKCEHNTRAANNNDFHCRLICWFFS